MAMLRAINIIDLHFVEPTQTVEAGPSEKSASQMGRRGQKGAQQLSGAPLGGPIPSIIILKNKPTPTFSGVRLFQQASPPPREGHTGSANVTGVAIDSNGRGLTDHCPMTVGRPDLAVCCALWRLPLSPRLTVGHCDDLVRPATSGLWGSTQ